MINNNDVVTLILKDIKSIVGGEIRIVDNTEYLYISALNKSIIVEIRSCSNMPMVDGYSDNIWSLWLWTDDSPSHIVPLNDPNAIKIITDAIILIYNKE